MAGYDLDVAVAPECVEEAKHLLRFLRVVGAKYPVRVNYRSRGQGRFYLTVDGPSGSIDAWIQELLLTRGAYYYAATRPDRRRVVSDVVLPILRELVATRFPNDYSRFLRHHVAGRGSPERYQPGEFFEPTAHAFEVLFRRWDIDNVSDKEFLNLLDDLITGYMLRKLRLPRGERTPRFDLLLKRCTDRGWLDSRARRTFAKIHRARTASLHRRARLMTRHALANAVLELYAYFDYVDDRFVKGERLFIPTEFR